MTLRPVPLSDGLHPDISGILVVDKPAGWTSSDVVSFLRGRTRIRRVGHTGTLDPAATGVLPVCFGQATRLAEYLTDAGKTYIADIELGVETNTYDMDGEVTRRKDASAVTLAAIEEALPHFLGTFDQLPPPFSAIKRGGVPLYKLARAGKEVELEPRRVHVEALRLLGFASPHLRLEIECAKGFYVRSLAHDLGAALGVGACLTGLVRTRVGTFSIDQAVDIDTLRAELEDGTWQRRLWAPDEVLLAWQAVIVSSEHAALVRNGAALQVLEERLPDARGFCRAYDADGGFLGVLRREQPGVWRPHKVFAS